MGAGWSALRTFPTEHRPWLLRRVYALFRNHTPDLKYNFSTSVQGTSAKPLETTLKDVSVLQPESFNMSERELQSLLSQTHQRLKSRDYRSALEHLTRAKLVLLSLNALVPSTSVAASTLLLARETLELAALVSIRMQDYDGFTRYFSQLKPFYDLPRAHLSLEGSNRNKIVGLYLLLLLSQGDYAGFHTLLESLELSSEGGAAEGLGSSGHGAASMDRDAFIQYPITLERWLMEGSYDRVWSATKSEQVPSEEYGIFSEVLVGTIRSEIASCSEKAYLSLPISNAKNLLFLDSEGSVVEFAQSRGWSIQDGRIYFPAQQHRGVGSEKEMLLASGQVIENTIGYARELETIV
ncbi:MAG: Superkiller protein 3 [Watsoniomyces obsoletus]|nr:MAG: Superkiller protein 3 [Watsoniomyces obsoletus]